MQKKKLLLLSLGTGSILGKDACKMSKEEKEQKILNREFSYRKAKYCMEGTNTIVESEFVAEPLIRHFQPDEIFLIGTSKSAWAGFYGKFGDSTDTKTIRRLTEIEEEGGKDIAGGVLRELSREVEQRYKDGLCTEVFRGRNVHVIMLHYGSNKGELMENYSLLRTMEGALDRTQSYEVAFDITHSFRSMPLYNLAILNYFKNVLQMDLTIGHVYYGNLDIKDENDGIAPIVDLGELVNILDLCGGVSEFKNTGNAVSLLQHIPDTEKGFKDALGRFDWATQVNSYNKIVDALEGLSEVTARKSPCSGDKFADLREMVSRVIRLKFFEEDGSGQGGQQDFGHLPMGEKQYLIAKWYFQQNRYGQAVATGMEALRSYLTPLYLARMGQESDEENIKVEDYRKRAIQRLGLVCKELRLEGRELSDVERLLCELEGSRKSAVSIRNVFAHNLSEQNDGSFASESMGDYGQARQAIENFICQLGSFRACLQGRREEVGRVYGRKRRKQRKVAGHSYHDGKKPACLVIAPPQAQVDYRAYQKCGNQSYEVFRLPDAIITYLHKKARQKNNAKANMVKSSLFLAQYVANAGFALQELWVVLYGLSMKQALNYVPALSAYGVRHISDERRVPIPKLAFPIQWEKEGWKDDECIRLMERHVIRVSVTTSLPPVHKK